ncbi:MAG: SPOR domain-containing protein [Magnetococcales bacterium]|nr:SPOR domain-containing protein [Magnetococcales bacterium]
MSRNRTEFSILFTFVLVLFPILFQGCAPPQTAIPFKQPPKVILGDRFSKVAILPFSTESKLSVEIKSTTAPNLAELLQSALYRRLSQTKEFGNVALEVIGSKNIEDINYHSETNSGDLHEDINKNTIIDGIITGRVWWRINNSPKVVRYPAVKTLKKWSKMAVGKDSNGHTIYDDQPQSSDEILVDQAFVSVRAELMTSITLYHITKESGLVDYGTYTFEMGTFNGVLDNGVLTLNKTQLQQSGNLLNEKQYNITSVVKQTIDSSIKQPIIETAKMSTVENLLGGLFGGGEKKSSPPSLSSPPNKQPSQPKAETNTSSPFDLLTSKLGIGKEKKDQTEKKTKPNKEHFLSQKSLSTPRQIQIKLADQAASAFVQWITVTRQEKMVVIRGSRPQVQHLLKSGGFYAAKNWLLNHVLFSGDINSSNNFSMLLGDLGASKNFHWPRRKWQQEKETFFTQMHDDRLIKKILSTVQNYLMAKKRQASKTEGTVKPVSYIEAATWLHKHKEDIYNLGIAFEVPYGSVFQGRGAFRLALWLDPEDEEAAKGIARFEKLSQESRQQVDDLRDNVTAARNRSTNNDKEQKIRTSLILDTSFKNNFTDKCMPNEFDCVVLTAETVTKQPVEITNSHHSYSDEDKSQYRYSVQVAAFREQHKAEKASKKFREQDFSPFILQVWSDDEQELWFTVQLGRFTNLASAQQLAEVVQMDLNRDAFVLSIPRMKSRAWWRKRMLRLIASYPYSVQVAAFLTEEPARQTMTMFRKQGLKAYLLKIWDDASIRLWYTIHVGRFDNKKDADKLVEELRDTRNIDAYTLSIDALSSLEWWRERLIE